MKPFIDTNPSILFNSELEQIENPDEMQVGNLFYISQHVELASGESVPNPFDIGPQLLSIPEIENQPLRDADILLLRLSEIHDDDTGTCEVVVEIDDAEEVYQHVQDTSDSQKKHTFKMANRDTRLNKKDIRGSLNHIITTNYQ